MSGAIGSDGIRARVTGTVRDTFTTAKGGGFELDVQGKGQYPDRVSVYMDPGPVVKGTRLTVEGDFTARLGSYDSPSGPKTIVKRQLWQPRIIEQADPKPDAQSWATGTYDAETPF